MPVFASVAGVLMLVGLVGAVAYRLTMVPCDHGARAESAMFFEASSNGVHSAQPDAAGVAQSEPSFEFMPSAQAAASGGLTADMPPTASIRAASEALTLPAPLDRTVPAASLTASSPGAGVSAEARLIVLPMVFSNNSVVTKAADGAENPQAGATSLSPSSKPASQVATEAPAAPPANPSASAAMSVDATPVPAAVQPEDPSPTAATVLPSQAAAGDADTPTVPAIAQPPVASASTETEAPSPPSSAQSPAPDNAMSSPVVPSTAASTAASDAAGTDTHTGSAAVQSLAPSSAAQSEPPPSDALPPAAPPEAMESDAGSDTGPTTTGIKPSARVGASTEAAPSFSSTPAVAPEVPASGAAVAVAPALPAALVPAAAAPPATQSPAATNAVPTVTATSKAPSVTSASSRFVSPDLGSLLSRGDVMLELGDISTARLLYQRAAAAGSAKAATALGKTYDPTFLASIKVSGLAPDRAAAASWYRKGADLGDAEAADRLARIAKAQ